MELSGSRRLVQANSCRLPQIWYRHLLPPSVSPPCARSIAVEKAVDQGLSRLADFAARSFGGAVEHRSGGRPGNIGACRFSAFARGIFSGNRRGIFSGSSRGMCRPGAASISRTIAENSIRRLSNSPRSGTGPIPHHGTDGNDRAAPCGGRRTAEKRDLAGETPETGVRRSRKPWCCDRGDVNLFVMSTSSADSRKVTYVTAALGLRLPLTRELCCHRCCG